jgi:hypothetical protein
VNSTKTAAADGAAIETDPGVVSARCACRLEAKRGVPYAMKDSFVKRTLILAALMASSAAAIGQAPTGETRIGPSNKADEIVCRREQVIGSRLATQRVCRTRAEWAEHRRQFRQSVDRAQQQSQSDYD